MPEFPSGRSPASGLGHAVVVSCPADDLVSIARTLESQPVALLPVGGPGDLGRAAGVSALLLVEITEDGPRSAVTWRGTLASSTPIRPDPGHLLPQAWVARHPGAYEASRQAGRVSPGAVTDDDWDHDETALSQLYLPVSTLERLPRERWLFSNELVPKQGRMGRTFAPPTPVVVALPPDD